MNLWIKYLQKLGIAFLEDGQQLNKSNIKWERDTKFFEIYQMKKDYEMKQNSNSIEKKEQIVTSAISEWSDFFKADNFNENMIDDAQQQQDEQKIDTNELKYNDTVSDTDSDSNIEDDELANEDSDKEESSHRFIVKNLKAKLL